MFNIDVVINEVAAHYKSNDAAHQIGHAHDVYRLTCRIVDTLRLLVNPIEIAYAAYYHDTYSTCPGVEGGARQREIHHVLGGEFVALSPTIGRYLTSKEILRVRLAVEQHRSSFAGTFDSPLAEAMSSADRGIPCLRTHIIRAKAYRGAGDPEEVSAGVLAHMREKYGRGGTGRYPEMYRRVFRMELVVMQDEIEALTLEDVINVN